MEGTEIARLRRQFSFVLQQALSFRMRHHLCKQGLAFAGTRQLRSQGPVSAHAQCTEGVTRCEEREGASGNGNGNGVGDGAEFGTGKRQENKGKAGAGMGAGTGVETIGRTPDGNGDRSGTRNEIGDGKWQENGEGTGGGGELWHPPHQEIISVED